MWINVYLIFISRDWKPIIVAYVALGILAWFILVFFVPESPKWLMIEGRTAECVEVLKKIAQTNGSNQPITFLQKNVVSPTISKLSKRSKKSSISAISNSNMSQHAV